MAGLIINADDLGVHPEINRGILEAYRHGVLTSSTLLVTTKHFKETVANTILPTGLPVGIHLCLTHGWSVAARDAIPDLIDDEGRFRHTARKIVSMRAQEKSFFDQVRTEFNAQIELARDHGVRPTHLDSHQHVHMNPTIFGIVEDLAAKHGIRAMRFTREPVFAFELRHRIVDNLRRMNPVKVALLRMAARRIRPRVRTNDAFFGVMYSGNFDKPGFLAFLRAIDGDSRIWEAGVHPGFPASPHEAHFRHRGLDSFISSPHRRRELDVLLDPDVRTSIERHKITLMSFASLAAMPGG